MTPTQYQTLKAGILADPNCAAMIPPADWPSISNYLNETSTWVVWATFVPVDNVNNAITWASLTSTDTADGTATYTNRILLCQAKQMNLQILLQGREQVWGSKANVRNGLKDALQNIPSGTGGALLDAGWTAVKAALTRFATVGEKLYSLTGGAGTSVSPCDLGYDGQISPDDVQIAMVRY